MFINMYPEVSSAREILSIFVERYSHDTVSGVESLLNTISMMDINIYVQNSLVVPGNVEKHILYIYYTYGFAV